MYVTKGCRGKFRLRCSGAETPKWVSIACGFPGQRKAERVNCTPGESLEQVKNDIIVGFTPRPLAVPHLQPLASGSRPKSIALALHGKLGTWLRSASELHIDRAASSRTRGADGVASVAVTAAGSFTQHLIQPNRRRGLRLEVFVHSWSTEAAHALDTRLKPAASLYEELIHEDKVLSQHLSIKRVLSLVRNHSLAAASSSFSSSSFDLVFVSRIDLFFYSDLLLDGLSADTVWLPQYCQQRWRGLAVEEPLVRAAQRETCGCSERWVSLLGSYRTRIGSCAALACLEVRSAAADLTRHHRALARAAPPAILRPELQGWLCGATTSAARHAGKALSRALTLRQCQRQRGGE